MKLPGKSMEKPRGMRDPDSKASYGDYEGLVLLNALGCLFHICRYPRSGGEL